MTRVYFVSVLLALLPSSLLLGDEARTISVAGFGELIVEPDSARVELAVSSTGTDLRIAKQEVDKIMAALLEMVKRLKIADDDVSATQLQVEPEWDYEKQRKKSTALKCHDQ